MDSQSFDRNGRRRSPKQSHLPDPSEPYRWGDFVQSQGRREQPPAHSRWSGTTPSKSQQDQIGGGRPRTRWDVSRGGWPEERVGRPVGKQSQKPFRAKPPRGLAIATIVTLAIIAICSISGVVTAMDLLNDVHDAKSHLATIEKILKAGQLSQVSTITAIQSNLRVINVDLQRIQSNPAEQALSITPGVSETAHALRLAQDLVSAGLKGTDAALILLPHIKGIFGSLSKQANAKPGANPSPTPSPTASTANDGGPITRENIDQMTSDVNAAGSLIQQALAERAQISDSTLNTLGMGSYVTTLHKFDTIAPMLPTYLGDARQLLAALPDLTGITKPTNYLVLDLDSDEIRPAGGFQGVYGVVTVSGGQLTGGVHLKNIYTLDCPQGFPAGCIQNTIPSQFPWFPISRTVFGLRDAGLDPDYPSSARLDEKLLSSEGGPKVTGVISITPALIQAMLQIVGPISIPGYSQSVTASNFRELIHYYHSTIGSRDITENKTFDALLGNELLARVAQQPASKQATIMQQFVLALHTHDLQLYFNDSRVESLLTQLNISGAVQTPPGDSLLVVDSNVSATYANADVTEVISDSVTFNAQGSANHSLTINYHFPVRSHKYSQSLTRLYGDIIQVIVPARSHLKGIQGCATVNASQAGHADWSCKLVIWQGNDATVRIQWTTPNVVTRVQNTNHYSLLVQRQAGAKDSLDLTIASPVSSHLTQPLGAPLKLDAAKHARYSAPLIEDISFALGWTN